MKKLFTLFFLFFLMFQGIVTCQQSDKCPVKFGKILPGDFKANYNITSKADAIIIADIGFSQFSGNNKGWFTLEFTRQLRIHILNKNAYGIADFEIPLFSINNSEEELMNLKGTTYNLENNQIIETKLDKNSVFKDRIDKNTTIKKFTLPALKEGSIVEVEYKIKSDFMMYLRSWTFQSKYPILWSEYKVAMPVFFSYIILSQGYQKFYIKETIDRIQNFNGSNFSDRAGSYQPFSIQADVRDCRWVMKNVPALKQESFTSSLSNHIAKIEFQLSEIRAPLNPKRMMNTWEELSDELMNDEDFGVPLSRDSFLLIEAVPGNIRKIKENNLQKAKLIYEYIRDNYACIDDNARYMSQSFRNLIRTKRGNVVDINLMLVGILQAVGYKASPVILGLKSRGITFSEYPIFSRFNYVISQLDMDGKKYYMDATKPLMGFDRLDAECYNGHARVIHAEGEPDSIAFNPDSLFEDKNSSVFVSSDSSGNFRIKIQQTPGYYESAEIRQLPIEKNKDKFMDEIKMRYDFKTEIENFRIDSLTKKDFPVTIFCDFKMNFGDDDLVYFNPMLSEAYLVNPFKSTERSYPVEMPYAIDKIYSLSMEVPAGYNVDELPKPLVLKLNDQGECKFEYFINLSEGMISLRCRLQIKRTLYDSEEYNLLRDFFNMVVNKQNEQIVFKKKK